MGIIATDADKVILYYHSGTSLGKQTNAYLQSFGKKILTIDIAKTNVPGSHWVEISDGLGLEIEDLIDMDHPDYVNTYGKDNADLEEHDWLKLLEKMPQVLTYPIAIIGKKFIHVENPSDLAKHIENDSAGIDE